MGEGQIGGKAVGLATLDGHPVLSKFPSTYVPRWLVVCPDVFNLGERSFYDLSPVETLREEAVSQIIDTVRSINFGPLALRSSAPVEDQFGWTAAGAFLTEFHVGSLDDAGPRAAFVGKLNDVLASAYSQEAKVYWRRAGYTQMPPLAVVIQELAGKEWPAAPGYFFPAIAGIANTASSRCVKVATVLGHGYAAVAGAGLLHKFPLSKEGTDIDGGGETDYDLNRDRIFCLETASGDLVRRVMGEGGGRYLPPAIFHEEIANFPKPQQAMARIALNFQQELWGKQGKAVDMEWAKVDERLALLQIRPIKKLPNISWPEVEVENIICTLRFGRVTGSGVKSFRSVIGVFCKDNIISAEIIARYAGKYPDSLIIYRTAIYNGEEFRQLGAIQYAEENICKALLPNAGVIIVDDMIKDEAIRKYLSGTGLEHLALQIADEEKIVACTENRLLSKLLASTDFIKAETAELEDGIKIDVLFPKRKLCAAACEEDDRFMLYFE